MYVQSKRAVLFAYFDGRALRGAPHGHAAQPHSVAADCVCVSMRLSLDRHRASVPFTLAVYRVPGVPAPKDTALQYG
eukprot:3831656-Prymnesium_polylepis.1